MVKLMTFFVVKLTTFLKVKLTTFFMVKKLSTGKFMHTLYKGLIDCVPQVKLMVHFRDKLIFIFKVDSVKTSLIVNNNNNNKQGREKKAIVLITLKYIIYKF